MGFEDTETEPLGVKTPPVHTPLLQKLMAQVEHLHKEPKEFYALDLEC